MFLEELLARLAHVEELIHRLGLRLAPPTIASDTRPEVIAVQRLDALGQRIRTLTAEVELRRDSDAWDAADTIVVRLLLDELIDAVRQCRALGDGAAARLATVHTDLRESRRVMHREARIAAATATTS